MSTGSGADGGGGGGEAGGAITLRKELGLWDGVAIIIGVIIGAGIFVSPKGVLVSSGSTGLAVVVWVLSGLLSLNGALCYAELGTMIPKSGGDYAYIGEAFGPVPAFLYLWVALFVIVPTGNAITALTFAQYILQPMWPTCQPPDEAVRLLAAAVTCILTAVNCYNVRWATRVQDIFTGTKLLALLVIIVAGAYVLGAGKVTHTGISMEGTSTSPGYIALSFYSGLFSYAGWCVPPLPLPDNKRFARQQPKNLNLVLSFQELPKFCDGGA